MKTEKQQTAVEYLSYAWAVQGAIYQDDIDKALEMEKELIIAIYTDLKMKDCQLPYGMQYHNELLKALEEAKKYYYETFKQQEQ